MGRIVVIGGGVVGMITSLLLAGDGHDVVVLERDPAPPPADGETAWRSWERRSVSQFRQAHFLQPGLTRLLARELPAVLAALEAEGARRVNLAEQLPVRLTGGPRPGDERFDNWTARRPVAERALAGVVSGARGIDVRRGVVVRGLATADAATARDVPRVVGVVTEQGTVPADLVLDVSGRRSALASWLDAIGAKPMPEEADDSGFTYYTRHFRSPDGSVPPMIAPLSTSYGSLSVLTLPADNGTWAVVVITSSSDRAMRALTDADRWSALVASLPPVAHWIDAEPLTGVDAMTNVPDRIRHTVVDGRPVVDGFVPVGDACACTNPSVGRGITLGAMHAVEVRDAIREVGLDPSAPLVARIHDGWSRNVEPWVRDTIHLDRHRLAEIGAAIEGRPYVSDDPAWRASVALAAAAAGDAGMLRNLLEVVGVLARATDVLAREGVSARLDLGAEPRAFRGVDRAAIEAILAG